MGEKYSFKPENFIQNGNSSNQTGSKDAAEISTIAFELCSNEEKELSKSIKFRDVAKRSYQRAEAFDNRLSEENEYQRRVWLWQLSVERLLSDRLWLNINDEPVKERKFPWENADQNENWSW